jgi:hypothetical protein
MNFFLFCLKYVQVHGLIYPYLLVYQFSRLQTKRTSFKSSNAEMPDALLFKN